MIPRLKVPFSVTGYGQDPETRRRITEINQHRLVWLLSIFVFVHVVHIVAFWPYAPIAHTETETWRNGVILVHAALLVIILVALPGVLWLKRHGPKTYPILQWIPEATGLVYLLAGAALAIVDQRVTSSINALMVASIGMGLAITTRPVVGFIQYLLTLALFLVGVEWVQKEPSLLLTVRVNSISAIGLGFGLTLLRWRHETLALHQERRIQEQQTELEAKNQELTILATTDALTGLLNRAEFDRKASQEICRLQGTGMPICLILADVDHFKAINDAYGHYEGDRILVEVAAILTRTLGSTDIIGRFGGEEFVVLLPGHSVDMGVQVAERLRSALCDPIARGEHAVNVTASFGVAGLDIALTDALSQAFRAADQALYQAKNDGRNCVRY